MALTVDLSGRVVLVTGGTRGIGLGISAAFRAAGARVLTCSRSEVDAEDHYVCDVRDPDAVRTLVARVVADAGRLDVLVNNAGGAPYALAAEASPRFHDKIVGLNLLAPLLCAQAANAVMQQQERGGAIVNISSISATRPAPGTAAYGAAKAGLDSLTGALAMEWAPKVRVNAIDVGLCRTGDTRRPLRRRRPGGRDRAHHPARPDGPAGGGGPRCGVLGQRPGVVRLRRPGRVPRRGRAPGVPVCPAPGIGRKPMSLLEGRVAIVTGAGRGIGRAHALELAAQGAAVVVNDFGVSLSGEGTGESPADEVVAAIEAAGGRAVANGADVADFEQAAAMVRQAVDTFGGLDILVNNAGFVRDRMLVNTSEEEWDAVIRVHLKGHFAPLRHAGAYWRAEAKEGRQRAARVINTSSGAGLQGSVGQATYSAAKAGIAGLTLVAAQEMGRYGVTVNAIAPVAKTRMTEGAFDTSGMALPEDNSPVVAWLASEEAGDVTGRVIEIDGGRITVETGWAHGPSRDNGQRWAAAEVGPALRELIAQAPTPEPVYGA